jgi:hypothetical protein
VKLVPAKLPTGNLLIYEYGVRLDKDAIEPAVNQILISRRLYNNIIAEIRATIEQMRADVLRKAGDSAQFLQARIDLLSGNLIAAREANDEELRRKIIAERRELWKELAVRLKSIRAAFRAEYQERFFSRIGKKSTCATYQLRCQAVAEGLGWATANTVLDSALAAFKKSFSTGNAPRFAIAEKKAQDSLTLQFTTAGGVRVESLLSGANSDLVIRPINGCGPRKYGELKFRLGRAADNQFATGTWQYHRPLPMDACIGRARLLRRKIGKDYRWYLQLQVKTSEPKILNAEGRKPLAAIHFGCAFDVSGRRVAGFADSAEPSAAQIIRLPPSVEQALRRSAKLQSQRDKLRDALIPRIKAELISNIDLIKAELDDIRRLSAQYVSPSRLHRLCRILSTNAALPIWLEEWRKIDRQLWQAAAHGARRARNQRRDYYRKFALDLTKQYSTVVIESPNPASLSKNMNGRADGRPAAAKKSVAGRLVAAPYELESAMRWACAKTNTALLELHDANTLSTCAICGMVDPNSSTESTESLQVFSCLSCGAHIDRKQNGAALAFQMVTPIREDAVEEFFLQAAENRQMQEVARTEKREKIQNARSMC